MYEIKKDIPYGEFALMVIKLHETYIKLSSVNEEPTKEEWDAIEYRDFDIARALLKEDRDTAISVANIIKASTGK